MNYKNKSGFTLVELLAVIVILAVVILIAVTAVIPRMNKAKKNALVDEALVYLNAAKESLIFDADDIGSRCINISDLNENYVKKDSNGYSGVIKICGRSGSRVRGSDRRSRTCCRNSSSCPGA